MSDFLSKARQLFNLPDEDLIEGQQQVLSQKPQAQDDEIIQHMVHYAEQTQPKVLKTALTPSPSEQDVQGLYDLADQRAKERKRKTMLPDILSGVGNIIMGRADIADKPLKDRERSLKEEEYGKVKDKLGREDTRRKTATEQFKLAENVKLIEDRKAQQFRAQEQAKREADPSSEESRVFQDLIKKITGQDFSSAPASILKQHFPQITSIYAKRLDIEEKNRERRIKEEEKFEERKSKQNLAQLNRDETTLNNTIDTVSTIRRGANSGMFGKARQRETLARDGLAIIEQAKNGEIDLDQRTAQELAMVMASMLSSGNQPAMQTIEHLVPKSARGDAARIADYITSSPQKFLSDKYIDQFIHQLARQRDFYAEEVNKILGGQYHKLRGVFDRNPDLKGRWDAVLESLFPKESTDTPKKTMLRRKDKKTGKMALFDPDTKQFVRWE